MRSTKMLSKAAHSLTHMYTHTPPPHPSQYLHRAPQPISGEMRAQELPVGHRSRLGFTSFWFRRLGEGGRGGGRVLCGRRCEGVKGNKTKQNKNKFKNAERGTFPMQKQSALANRGQRKEEEEKKRKSPTCREACGDLLKHSVYSSYTSKHSVNISLSRALTSCK